MSPGYNGGCQRLGRRILELRICRIVWAIAGTDPGISALDSSSRRRKGLLVPVPTVLGRWHGHHEGHGVK